MIEYINAIKIAVLIFPIVFIVILIPFIIYQKYKYKSFSYYRLFVFSSFVLYFLILYLLVILPLSNNKFISLSSVVRIIPFSFIKDFIDKSSLVLTDFNTYIKAIKEPCFYTAFFNIIMMMPMGIYLRYYFKCNLKNSIIICFLVSLFFELTQLSGLYFLYPYPYRVFDVDDLMMNTLGGIIGYLMFDL